ncbi:dermonecrotic toxin domain-containing protein [Pseudomonas fluorescens]|uniref:Dermonecrotic toxin N-terminal domain-containing protein n=1 Tax=Pseudomonas fluorescens TaxID=294 RepID=A0A5E7A4W8_PSEFL|nr:DUF6543 domain-containing protein [Pseudomonas fluorescens]VVN71934.1 hypothetical protein PS691_00471 [Pseudomonas fluorescens]
MDIITTQHPVSMDARPEWFEHANAADRQHYLALERDLESSEAELAKLLGHFASVRVYARYIASYLLNNEFGSDLDPDRIMTSISHVFEVGSKTLVQQDERTLTELFLYGLHDQGQRYEITFKGEDLPTGLTRQWLEDALEEDVRAAYGAEIRSHYLRPAVIRAMGEVLKQRLALTAFTAKIQGHLGENFERIMGAIAGDADLTLECLQLHEKNRPLKDVMVVRNRNGQGEWLLYAPGSPGGRDWYQCVNLRGVGIAIGEWTQQQKGRDYLTWQSHALDREAITGYLKQVEAKPTLWIGVIPAPNPYIDNAVLNSSVSNVRAWLVSNEEAMTPYGYRTATTIERQYFARLNTELRALHTVAVREGGFISYEKFSYNLIKERLGQLLAEHGEYTPLNPDHIVVEMSPNEKMTLTQLIIKEYKFEVVDNPRNPLYPRLILTNDHPPLKALTIQGIANWSRTLRPGEKYIDMLRSIYLDMNNSETAFKRSIHFEIQQRQMQVAIMSELFQGRLLKDKYDRLRELVHTLSSIDTIPMNPMGEYPNEVLHNALFQFHIEGRLVEGVFVFRLLKDMLVEEFLYTPDAPDGRCLRPMSEFVLAVKERGLGDYFYRRVRYTDQRVVGTYITELELNSNFTDAPVLGRNSRVRNLAATYEGLIDRIIADVDAKTESLNDIISGLVFNAVTAAASVISLVYAPIGLALSAVLITKSLLEGAEAYNDGDRAKALSHFIDALIDLALLGHAGIKGKPVSGVQKTLIQLLGDVNTAENLIAQISGQQRLHQRVLEVIQEVLDDSNSAKSKTLIR